MLTDDGKENFIRPFLISGAENGLPRNSRW